MTVDPQTLLIADLRRLYNEDPSELKETASLYLAYIHIVSQIDSTAPYFKSDTNEVRQLARKQLFGSADFAFTEQLELFLEDVIIQYQQAYEEPDARAARIFKKKVDNLLKKIDDTQLEIKESTSRGGTVSFSSNFPIISKMMNDVIPLIDTQSELEARVKKMGKGDAKIRGNKRESILNKRLKSDQPTE